MLSLFGFGKRRRRSTKSRKSAKKGGRGRKPPAALLKMCKKYRVKTTVKRGTKRVYKKARLLKKLCMRKKKMMLKKKKKVSKKSRKVRRTRRVRRSRFGGEINPYTMKMSFGENQQVPNTYKQKALFGNEYAPNIKANKALFGNINPYTMKMSFGSNCASKYQPSMAFGKRRGKLTKPAAMQAFKQFYRRYCRSSKMGGRFRFGNGGNPPLSMGYEFCPSGQGGVLGANSTGLFPSPCTPMNAAQAAAEANVALPTYAPAAAFGRRQRYPRKCYGKGKSRYCLRLKPKRKNLYYLSSRGRA